MTYWRVTSYNRLNLKAGIAAGRWGQISSSSLRSWQVGDKVAFYCSGQMTLTEHGYWGLAVVKSEMIVERTRIWGDGDYPFRVVIESKEGLLSRPVKPRKVREALGGIPLRFMRRRAIIRLSDDEYATIAEVIESARREQVAS